MTPNRVSSWVGIATLLLWGCGSEDATGPDGAATSGGGGDSFGGDASNNEAGSPNQGEGGANGGSPSSCTSKRGIAYAFDRAGANADMAALLPRVTWFYDWGIRPSEAIRDHYASLGVEFVPMIHNGGFDVDAAIAAIPEGAKYLLGFNEPNFGVQANLTPEAAAALWPRVEQIADARNLKIVSPALNYCGGNCNETDPFVWLDKFFAACDGCRVDYIGAHWYNCDIESLEHYLSSVRNYHRPIWLTEFACWFGPNMPYSEADAIRYAQDAAVYLEAQEDVFRYAWFTGRTSEVPNASLLGDTGTLTKVGNSYGAAEAADCP